DAKFAQLLDELDQPFAATLELVLELRRLLTPVRLLLEVCEAFLMFSQFAGQGGDVLDDAAYQRQHRVGLCRRKVLLSRTGLSGSHGAPLSVSVPHSSPGPPGPVNRAERAAAA